MPDLVENTLVDGRYRIGDRLGSGGMADVYSAEDSHLGRHVALKILHRRFARDENFVERFRREASSAASLQHPNIVGIFDRGEYDGTYYIAMEHLRGASLKEIVDAESPSPQLRTVDLGVQILEAAAHAHANGVIHRDFKPHNVIVDADGRAKVTDFGIARAGASEVTETGSIMGTAHYLSPEQAQGQRVTAASDIYSIGVVLYEMLAGHVPFHGESAVSIALKHLSEEPAPISASRPDVHPLLEAAVMRALAKDPAERHADADAFAEALRGAREAILAEGDVVVERAAVVPPPPADPVAEEGEERKRRWPWILLVLLALAALAVGLWALFFRADTVQVPDVVGQDLPGARAAMERRGLEVAVRPRPDPAPPGEVVAQRPGARAEAEEGSTVTLAVSRGPGRRSVPSVRRLSERAAVARLNRAGFRVESVTRASADVPPKLTIGTDPRVGTEIAVGARVRLFISSGPRQVEVPRVVGLSRGAAESTLSRRGFAVDVETTSSDAPEDEVIEQAPGEGTTADDGSTVTLTVSSGPPPDEPAPRATERADRPAPRSERPAAPARAEVPDVVGRPEAEAAAALRRAGFRVRREVVTRIDPDEDGEVIRQSPSGGSRRRGSSVTIVVGRVDAPSNPPPGSP